MPYLLPATIIEVTLPVPIVYPIAKIPGPKAKILSNIFLNNELELFVSGTI